MIFAPKGLLDRGSTSPGVRGSRSLCVVWPREVSCELWATLKKSSSGKTLRLKCFGRTLSGAKSGPKLVALGVL